MQTYRVQEPVAALAVGGVALMTLAAIPFTAALFAGNVEAPGFAVVWLFGLAWYWYLVLTTTYEISLAEDGILRYRALLGRGEIHAADVESVKKWIFFAAWLATVRHRNGSFRIASRMDGLHELLSRLREANPGLRTSGI